jgi:hypothetical protein
MKPNEYKCECCSGIFEEDWSDEEAIAEAKKDFNMNKENTDQFAKVCDDCYKAIIVNL